MDGFLEFLIGRWLGVRDERRRVARETGGRRSALERGTVALLRRIFPLASEGAERATARVLARDPVSAAAARAAEDARAQRRRERLRRARASARRRMLRKAGRTATLVLVIAGLLLVLAILGRLSERHRGVEPAGTTTITIRHRS